MRAYITYFKVEFLAGLQYKTAAISGLVTQFFWGLMYIALYLAVYKHTKTSMSIEQLITYVWLNQAFLALTYINFKDANLIAAIKSGDIAYEIVRPYNLYLWWYFKMLAKKYSNVLLRFAPVIIISLLLPKPYNLSLPPSFLNLILFFITLGLGSFIVVAFITLIQLVVFYTINEDGIFRIVFLLAEFFSGFVLPIPLFPLWLQKISAFLPFRYIGDLAFRVYSNNVPLNEAIKNINIQLFWIIFLVILGLLITKNSLKKVHIQGG